MADVNLSKVKKSYDKTEVVHGVDLDIKSGEFVVFVGPSGCGKSTLLRMIAGLEEITEGEISIEGEIVNYIQNLVNNENSWIVINPGAYTHTSIAIRDALQTYSQNNAIVEVHISDINQREQFRKINLISDICNKSIIGRGVQGYIEALEYINEQ